MMYKTLDELLEELEQGSELGPEETDMGAAKIEQAVGKILEELQGQATLCYETRRRFTNLFGEKARADYVIPSRKVPRIVIEARGCKTAGGKKPVDIMEGISQILKVKDPETHFFVVIEGHGWHQHSEALRSIIDLHQRGYIDMIFTRKTLPQLRDQIRELVSFSRWAP